MAQIVVVPMPRAAATLQVAAALVAMVRPQRYPSWMPRQFGLFGLRQIELRGAPDQRLRLNGSAIAFRTGLSRFYTFRHPAPPEPECANSGTSSRSRQRRQ